MSELIEYNDEVHEAIATAKAIVALESTIIAHGMPWPANLQCAQRLEAIVREHGAVPATIAIADGRIRIGLTESLLRTIAQSDAVAKVSRRDLPSVLARGGLGATTVAATAWCANQAGIRIFATGGIGGVHRGAEHSFDISADLVELAKTTVAVVCAGAKSILDLPKTLEVLETYGVPVIGYQTSQLPAFYVADSGLKLTDRIDSALEAAKLIRTRERLGLGGGEVVAVPVPAAAALPAGEVEGWIAQASDEARVRGIRGKVATPFLLKRIVELSEGKALAANVALVENNARIAANIATALAAL